jgi:uncharacterized protein
MAKGGRETARGLARATSPAVLMVPGWDDDRRHYRALASQLGALGCVCRLVDLPNESWSPAERKAVTPADNLQDVLCAYDALAAEPAVAPDRIVLVGVSYGGYLAAFAGAMRPARSLALRAPALYRDEDWAVPKAKLDKQDLSIYRLMRLRPPDNRVLQACAAFRGDVLLIESGHDETVPHPVIANYLSAFEQARSVDSAVLVGADHALSHPDWQSDFNRRLLSWLGARAFMLS